MLFRMRITLLLLLTPHHHHYLPYLSATMSLCLALIQTRVTLVYGSEIHSFPFTAGSGLPCPKACLSEAYGLEYEKIIPHTTSVIINSTKIFICPAAGCEITYFSPYIFKAKYSLHFRVSSVHFNS